MFIEQMNEELSVNAQEPEPERVDLTSMGFKIRRTEGVLSEDYVDPDEDDDDWYEDEEGD